MKKDVLAHLDVRPGDKLEVQTLANGEVRLRAARGGRHISEVFGSLKAPPGVSLTIEEMNEVIADGWAGKLEDHG